MAGGTQVKRVGMEEIVLMNTHNYQKLEFMC